MRLIKNYGFNIGTKIPFSEWAEIVHRFLSENRLSHHTFLYHFEDLIIYRKITDGFDIPECGCKKLLNDCPSLGEIRHHNGKGHPQSDYVWLSNIDTENGFSEEAILPLMKKIHRRYGITENILYYYDIDFFGFRTHFERDYSVARNVCNSHGIPFDPTVRMQRQPYGSGIELHRDILGDNYLLLSVDIMHNGEVLDATPYYESMQRLLPKVKPHVWLSIYLSDEEKQQIERIDRSASSVLEECKAYLENKLRLIDRQNFLSSNYSVAKPLKTLAKKYGFEYKLVWNGGVFSLEKRTARDNVLYLGVDCGPSRYSIDVRLSFQGIGFNHILCTGNLLPTNQQEADADLEDVMRVLSEFENTLLPSLDKLYPETPDWFIASDN